MRKANPSIAKLETTLGFDATLERSTEAIRS